MDSPPPETPLVPATDVKPSTIGPAATGSSPATKDGPSEAFFKAVEKIPYIGPTLVFIIKKWGWAGLALFASGIVLTLALVKFPVLPDWFISEGYKGTSGNEQPAETKRVKAQDFAVNIIEQEPAWLKTQITFLTFEGIFHQQIDRQMRFIAKAVDHEFAQPTDEFKWSISTEAEFAITAIAFRVTKQGLLEPLESTASPHLVLFKVPKCETGDKLVAVLRIQFKSQQSPSDVRSTFRTAVQK
jgi:hypothetical protein